MAIGYQITQNALNARAGSLAVRLDGLVNDTNSWQGDIVVIGNSGLQALGFSPTDATAMITAAAQMVQLGSIYASAPQALFSFDTALAPLRGLGAPG